MGQTMSEHNTTEQVVYPKNVYDNCLRGYPPKSPLKPELKQQWLYALRSGAFSQTTAYLCRDGESFCCLGVLAVIDGKPPEALEEKTILDDVGLAKLLQPNTTPWGMVRDKYGFQDVSLQQILAAKNDTGKSFAQIADWIEANL